MADGFIVRRGGKAEEVLRTTNPSINFVSKTEAQIVVTFTNNDAAEADVFYGLTSPLTTKVTLATATTSSNITFSGLDQNTQYTISAYAIVTDATLKKIKSEIVSTSITTDALIYTAATGGTTLEYNQGGKRWRSHTFTSDGTFTVTTVGDAEGDRNKVDYLIIAGGGGGGSWISVAAGGGGGAGGYRTTNGTSGANSSAESKVVVTAQAYSINVGAGGAGGTQNSGVIGVNSSALGITSIGGGGGPTGGAAAETGGSGGGGGGGGVFDTSLGAGSGTANQGTNGGNGFGSGTSSQRAGGGGGGAGVAGTAAGNAVGGNGGNGLSNTLRTGSAETRAGGGGGSTQASGGTQGSAGTGGAGAGGHQTKNDASANTGSGGGGIGGTSSQAGNGGSGIVVIRYEIAPSV